jgi:hypothetical protein
MARQVQLRRGTTAEHSTFTGAVGEVTVDTDKDVAVVHDGSTAGGFPLGYKETVTAVTSSANSTVISCRSGSIFTHTLSENSTFTFSDAPIGASFGFVLKIVQDSLGSAYAVTWPASVNWTLATAPTLSGAADAVDVFVFYTDDGGVDWYGFTSGQGLE